MKINNIKKDEDEGQEEQFSPRPARPYKMYRRIITESLDVELDRYVGISFDYSDLYRELRDPAPYTTEVNLYLANNGGYTEGGVPLFYAFKRCKLPVHIHLRHGCYSMGAILALAGDTLEFEEGAVLMFHNYSGGHGGKGQELMDAAINYHNNSKKLDYSMCMPFLTKKEIEKIHADGDVYVNWYDEDLPKRIQRHFGKGK